MRVFPVVVIAFFASVCALAGENPADGSLTEDEAIQLAYSTLSSETGAKEEDIQLIHVARFNWPNSALGCPKPGSMYTQVIVPGYLVLLSHANKQHRMHIGNGRAVSCDMPRMPLKVNDMLLDSLKNMSREDLATRLGVEATAITVSETEPMVWPDTNLGCAGVEAEAVSKPVRGYLIKLDYRGRVYEYRTSRAQVSPCPPIVSE